MSATLNYSTPPPRSSRAALVLFIASLVAFFLFFLIVPPLITLAGTLWLRRRLQRNEDEKGLSHAAAAFATSLMGSALALLALPFACAFVGS
jgi:hypothetical protein